jgi:hypothetical protein
MWSDLSAEEKCMSRKTTLVFLLSTAILAAGCIDRKHVEDASASGEA